VLGEFGRFEEKAAASIPNFLISRKRGLIVSGDLCPDRNQISLGGECLEGREVGLEMKL
jgi:hypothetical protein